jgi:hypothetical protein
MTAIEEELGPYGLHIEPGVEAFVVVDPMEGMLETGIEDIDPASWALLLSRLGDLGLEITSVTSFRGAPFAHATKCDPDQAV